MKPFVYLILFFLLSAEFPCKAQYSELDSIILADRARTFRTFKVLPGHIFLYDAPNLRLGYQLGSDVSSWQFEAGYVTILNELRIDNPYDNLNGLALGVTRYLALLPQHRIYAGLNAEFRQIWFNRMDWVGQNCSDGNCKYERFSEINVNTQSPAIHLLLGHSSVGAGTNIQLDYEVGIGYKWAYSTDESLKDFFLFDVADRNPDDDWISKYSFRLNVNIGFRKYRP